MRSVDDSFSSTERYCPKRCLWFGRRRRSRSGMVHGASDTAGTFGGRVAFAKSAFDETDAGLGELVIVFPKGGGEGDGGDFCGFRFYLGSFCGVGGCGTVFKVGDALGGIGVFGDHLGLVFLEDAGDLAGVVFFLCVGEV